MMLSIQCAAVLLAGAGFMVISSGIGDSTHPIDVDKLPSIRELPDPFLKADGKRISSPKEWSKHRAHLKDLVLKYEYGPLPSGYEEVTTRDVASHTLGASGAVEREIVLMTGPGGQVSSRVFLSVPAGKGPFPAIITGDLGWGRIKPEIVDAVVKRGYVLVEFSRIEIAPDSAERGGVYAAFSDYNGGRVSAWAWGYHRVVDYLLTLPEIHKKRIAVTGHSRGGKAALLAGAIDERIAITAPNNSGCGGAGCYRYQAAKCETIEAITKNFPFWFTPGFRDFFGKEDRLPIDQHTVKALIAPRALLSTEALGDLWANPDGSGQSCMAAKEVYKFLGAESKIGIHYREGGHEQNLYDWTTLLDFADLQFFGKSPTREFNKLAFPDSKKPYSWSAPAH